MATSVLPPPPLPSPLLLPPLFLLLRMIAAEEEAGIAVWKTPEETLKDRPWWKAVEGRWRERTSDIERNAQVRQEGRSEAHTQLGKKTVNSKRRAGIEDRETEGRTDVFKESTRREAKEGASNIDKSVEKERNREKRETNHRNHDKPIRGHEGDYRKERNIRKEEYVNEEASRKTKMEMELKTEEESESGRHLVSAHSSRVREVVGVDEGHCGAWDRVRGSPFNAKIRMVYRGEGGLLHPGNGGDFGHWGKYDMCAPGSYAHAFRIKVEEPLGMLGDDTALNGVRLYCQSASTLVVTGSVTSSSMCWGAWRDRRTCAPGTFLRGLRLWVEEPQNVLDDVAATDLDMVCMDGSVMNGGGVCWGDPSGWLTCPQGYAICGIRTRVEGLAGLMGDNTALNDLMMVCCEL